MTKKQRKYFLTARLHYAAGQFFDFTKMLFQKRNKYPYQYWIVNKRDKTQSYFSNAWCYSYIIWFVIPSKHILRMCFDRLINADCSLTTPYGCISKQTHSVRAELYGKCATTSGQTSLSPFLLITQNLRLFRCPSFFPKSASRFLGALRLSDNHFTVIADMALCKQRHTDVIMILPPWTLHSIGRLDENRAGVKFPWSVANAVWTC